jgi:hypothetical protein
MTERSTQDVNPEEFRGGVPEPDDVKDGAAELARGIVPDEAADDAPPPDSSDPQDLEKDVTGSVQRHEDDTEMRIDLSAGDDADAYRHGKAEGAHGHEGSLGRHSPENTA